MGSVAKIKCEDICWYSIDEFLVPSHIDRPQKF